MDPLTAFAAFGPLAMELGKSLIARFIAPDTFKPSNVAEWLQMRASDIQLFKTMNEAGGTGSSYPWVEAIVKLQRPAVAAIALGTWCFAHLTAQPGADLGAVDNFAACVGFYLFGDRTLFHSRRAIAAATAKP
jgi:hypothetical protein